MRETIRPALRQTLAAMAILAVVTPGAVFGQDDQQGSTSSAEASNPTATEAVVDLEELEASAGADRQKEIRDEEACPNCDLRHGRPRCGDRHWFASARQSATISAPGAGRRGQKW